MKEFIFQEFLSFQKERVLISQNHNVDYEIVVKLCFWNEMTKWNYMCLRLSTKMDGKS